MCIIPELLLNRIKDRLLYTYGFYIEDIKIFDPNNCLEDSYIIIDNKNIIPVREYFIVKEGEAYLDNGKDNRISIDAIKSIIAYARLNNYYSSEIKIDINEIDIDYLSRWITTLEDIETVKSIYLINIDKDCQDNENYVYSIMRMSEKIKVI